MNAGSAMRSILQITDVAELPCSHYRDGIGRLSAEEFTAHKPDAHLMLLESGALRARCSLWWRSVPVVSGERIACIGHYEAADTDAADELLSEACRILATKDATLAVGPMDGSTWRRYRLVTVRGDEPPFFLEPDNPDSYPTHFESAGFTPLARYYSTLNDDLGKNVSLAGEMQQRLQNAGIRIRQLDAGAFQAELSRIYDISVAGFSNNFLYSAISHDQFVAMYAKTEQFVRPELVLFAEQCGTPVGFIFALPDMLRMQRGQAADTVILKSMAVIPELNGLGIGAWLLAQVSQNAGKLGFKRAIHALMHENNRSRTMSSRYGHEIRQYTLYSRRLS